MFEWRELDHDLVEELIEIAVPVGTEKNDPSPAWSTGGVR